VYAQPLELYVGQGLSAKHFEQELTRLGYIAQASVQRPGTYRHKADRVDLYVRAFRFPDESQPARRLKIGFDDDAVSSLTDETGTDVPVFRLDPLLIGSIFPITARTASSSHPTRFRLAACGAQGGRGPQVRDAPRREPARDPARLVRQRAGGQVEQGGSTLTQQLVKSYFLDSRRTLGASSRKRHGVHSRIAFREADIMNAYINEIYLGRTAGAPCTASASRASSISASRSAS
jgi:penicillin-binding protein 1B